MVEGEEEDEHDDEDEHALAAVKGHLRSKLLMMW